MQFFMPCSISGKNCLSRPFFLCFYSLSLVSSRCCNSGYPCEATTCLLEAHLRLGGFRSHLRFHALKMAARIRPGGLVFRGGCVHAKSAAVRLVPARGWEE